MHSNPPRSRALGLRSLAPQAPPDAALSPLWPVPVEGCPRFSDEAMQYPMEVAFEDDGFDAAWFEQPPRGDLACWSALLPPLAAGLSLGEGGTPLLPLPTARTGAAVHLKDESRNPTGSHKDRLNLCTVSAAKAEGAPGVLVASSGNHGVSAAAYAARAGLRCVVVVGPGVSPALRRALQAYGAEIEQVAVHERWARLRQRRQENGFHPVSNLTWHHTGHPWGPEGYKTIAYELLVQLGGELPGAVLVPTGYGELLFGLFKGFREIVALRRSGRMPRLFAVEPAARAPLHRAVSLGLDAAEVAAAPTRQVSIACTVSGYRGRIALRESGGRALRVDDAQAERAQRELAQLGLWQELSSAAGYAALEQLHDDELEHGVVVIGTSSGFKDP